MIQKRGHRYVVLTEDGSRILGSHPTEEKAKRQLAAIEIAKAARKKREAEGR